MDRRTVAETCRALQHEFSAMLEEIDGRSRFRSDEWERPGGGGGLTRILVGDGHIEKAAVNFSAVEGETPERLSEQLAAASSRFFATGVSIIIHPGRSPRSHLPRQPPPLRN